MNHHRNHLTARQLSDRLLLAHYGTDKADHHLQQARHYLLMLLTQDSGLMPELRATLVDDIENAIDDVHDMDVTFKDYAESIAEKLIERVLG
jgi:hypothetical protein